METINKQEKDIILVIDDQPNNLKVISSILGTDYSLSIANSGLKALKILEKVKPNLILLDIMMPEMDGFEVCKLIKANEDLCDIPIIFLTAKTEIDNVIKGFEYGAVDYLTKPFNIHELRVRVQNHLDNYHSNQIILQQKIKLEKSNSELIQSKMEIENRNEDLVIAQSAVEEHAFQLNLLNQKLMESEYNLQIMNDELKKLNAEKDKFFSIISHDIKSPLAGINALLELITDDFDTFDKDELTDLLNQMRISIKNLFSLLINLLEWAKIQRKQIKFNPKVVCPHKIISSIIDLTKSQAIAKNVSIVSRFEENLTFIADDMMIETIFRNLISNAIKFVNQGGNIEVGVVKEHNIPNEICFFVKDNGVGMSNTILNKLFRIDEHIIGKGTAGETGTGLGLILCKEFVDMHKGKIWVESEEGKGTTFYFTINYNIRISND